MKNILSLDFPFVKIIHIHMRPPEIQNLGFISLPHIDFFRTVNSIPLYLVNNPAHDIIKFEIVFEVGRPHEHKRLTSVVTGNLLKEGSAQFSSRQIANLFDNYGASLQIQIHFDYVSISVVSLKKYIAHLLPIIIDILAHPTFPQNEIDTFIIRQCQRLKIDLKRGEVLAFRELTENIFGKEHPYGYNSTADLYRALTREDLLLHHQLLSAERCLAFVSGNLDNQLVNKLLDVLSQIPVNELKKTMIKHGNVIEQPQRTSIKLASQEQASIRMGKRYFSRHHELFDELYVLNTIFGGYFGSRLNTNIRESKGFTYNIFSSLEVFKRDGFIYIGCDTSHDYVDEVISSVYVEAKRLADRKVGEEELQMVKNHLIGYLMTLLDGPINVSELVKVLIIEGKGIEQFDNFVQTILNITPERIRTLAERHLAGEKMWEIVVS